MSQRQATHNLLTKTKSKTQEQEEIKESNSIKYFVLIIGAVGVIGATAPFWHIFLPKDSTDSFIGFTNIRRFMYAFGIQFSLFVCSSFILWLKNYISEDFQEVKKIANIVGGCFVFTASYFIAWVFFAPSDFHPYLYYLILIVAAIVMTIATIKTSKLTVNLIDKYKSGLKTAVVWIVKIKSKVVPSLALVAHEANKHNTNNLLKDSKDREIRYRLNKFDKENGVVLEEIANKL